MKTSRLALTLCLLLPMSIFAQPKAITAYNRDYKTPTSYSELNQYVQELDRSSDLLQTKVIGNSVQNRHIFALCFSDGQFGRNTSKLKVLIFAQQHGNEQSGKEAVLLLAKELLKQENNYLFERLDIALIPQINPDGAEENKRTNSNGVDLNRNHLLLDQPETKALHNFFNIYRFDATVDVHEYSPYGESWENWGYRKNASVTLGALTNPNIDASLRKSTNDDALPWVLQFIKNQGYSSAIYTPGGPPGKDYIRHSTFDINDGRQSFGIQNSYSFIQEGMNGSDTYVDNLSHRSVSQLTGLIGFLNYFHSNHNKIVNLVKQSRQQLISGYSSAKTSIQANHVTNGTSLLLPVVKFHSQEYDKHDSIIIVNDYRPVVNSIKDVETPYGYLLPKDDSKLMDWIKAHQFITEDIIPQRSVIEAYSIENIDTVDFEGDQIAIPHVRTEIVSSVNQENYIILPISQLKGNMIVMALEPESMLGLSTYKNFIYLIQGTKYPVLRIK